LNLNFCQRLGPPCFAAVVLLSSLSWLSSGASAQKSGDAARRVADEENIHEAVIRKQMEEWFQGGDKSEAEAKDPTEKAIAEELNFKVFFVSIDGKDPSDKFLHRLQDIPRTIKKVSASEISKSHKFPVVDKATGKRGIIFSVGKVQWLDQDSVQIEGGYHCDGLCGAGLIFKLHRNKGKWVIQNSRMNWIS
jgi:hypothetical protein